MNTDEQDIRAAKIIAMLYGFAKGNFALRLQRSSHDDVLESIAVVLNMVAEEFEDGLFYALFINQRFTYDFIAHSLFLLDGEFIITDVNADVVLLLGYGKEEIAGQKFGSLLAADSQLLWLDICRQLEDGNAFDTVCLLRFSTCEGLLLSASCTVTRLSALPTVFVSCITVTDKSLRASGVRVRSATTFSNNKQDDVILQKLHDYIFEHLDTPLPGVKQLARLFGTNENKLKALSRNYLHTSIYQFYNNARLEKAHVMIADTPLPLQEVATLLGFEYYGNFSNAFKKRFGYAPSGVKRRHF